MTEKTCRADDIMKIAKRKIEALDPEYVKREVKRMVVEINAFINEIEESFYVDPEIMRRPFGSKTTLPQPHALHPLKRN